MAMPKNADYISNNILKTPNSASTNELKLTLEKTQIAFDRGTKYSL